ncbi:multicopper oxidase family protein [Kitasatospora sp. NPDC051984]|uniref:multicopper oxidase family protein n=1 Tax=Kitasatospora sp. NPDC051984 TaxID=3364059 RepID=UPI0037C6526B
MTTINRRSLLLAGLGLAGGGVLAACSGPKGGSAALVGPSGSAVAAAETKRAAGGAERTVRLTAAATPVDLGGTTVNTWTFGGQLPGQEIRLTAGDTLVAQLANNLAAPTSIHWHGLSLRNDMDGVPPVTMREVPAGGSFDYRFIADRPGTYWYHPHVGVQLDRGLYGPLIVEDPHEPLKYDDEWVVVLDDWLDGVTGTPDEAFAELSKGMGGMNHGMDGMDHGSGGMGSGGMDMGQSPSSTGGGMSMKFMLMGATSALLGGDAGDVNHPHHLINGRLPAAPAVKQAKPGARVRLRIINAGGDTAYRVALGGHRLTVTHTDGYPVEHQEVDALLLGMGERYDVLVTLQDGVFPLVSLAEGKNATGTALIRTGSGQAPEPSFRPTELDGRLLTADQLRADQGVRLAARTPDVTHRLQLTGGMARYDWSINGRRFDMNDPTAGAFLIGQGQRVRLEFTNSSEMWHPMHLHGHTFQVGDTGPRKDTVIVKPKQRIVCDFDADNPGQWMVHCHNAYHGESGMMGLVAYRA